jgi:hypothetical protein
MPGTESYHALPQQFRIQKRLVLNQSFKSIKSQWRPGDTINYVTFGGEHLYDLMDLVSVFDIREQRLNVVSFEEDHGVAARSRTCAVATTLSKVPTISIEIVPAVFSDNVRRLRQLRTQGPFIYFLDDTKTFREHQANNIVELLQAALLRQGDWLLVTSSLRVVYQSRFMNKYNATFRTYFGARTSVTREFRARNHVDLLVAHTFSSYRPAGVVQGAPLRATLLRKYKYRDTSGMGLWLFRIDAASRYSSLLADMSFEEFPHAFEHVPEKLKVPDIFED